MKFYHCIIVFFITTKSKFFSHIEDGLYGYVLGQDVTEASGMPMPEHRLCLKVWANAMLLHNLEASAMVPDWLYNACMTTSLGVSISNSRHVLIPQISDVNLPCVLERLQFPVRLGYSMTINKAQGQTFNRVGIYIFRCQYSVMDNFMSHFPEQDLSWT